jgi:hypothetical protein
MEHCIDLIGSIKTACAVEPETKRRIIHLVMFGSLIALGTWVSYKIQQSQNADKSPPETKEKDKKEIPPPLPSKSKPSELKTPPETEKPVPHRIQTPTGSKGRKTTTPTGSQLTPKS